MNGFTVKASGSRYIVKSPDSVTLGYYPSKESAFLARLIRCRLRESKGPLHGLRFGIFPLPIHASQRRKHRLRDMR